MFILGFLIYRQQRNEFMEVLIISGSHHDGTYHELCVDAVDGGRDNQLGISLGIAFGPQA